MLYPFQLPEMPGTVRVPWLLLTREHVNQYSTRRFCKIRLSSQIEIVQYIDNHAPVLRPGGIPSCV